MRTWRLLPNLAPAIALIVVSAVLSGCAGGGTQSMLDPAGEQSSRISGLWWFYLAVLGGVFTMVLAAVLAVVALHWKRQEERMTDSVVEARNPHRERKLTKAVMGSVLITVVLLFVLLFADIFTERAVSSPAPPDAMTISITGYQWWWNVRYEDPVPSKIVTTANELRIPRGKPVQFKLQSSDVIHSFWIPNLHGKKDLIPGHPTMTWFVATRPGVYRGQCAEFCGYQHAHMQLTIRVENPEEFANWLESQRRSAPEPATGRQKRGQQIFLGSTCVMCHAIQGTPARASVGPDLTHVAGRERIGAGALPNTREYLASWITNPQEHKPGAHMPQHTFAPEDLHALLDYLETLK